MISIEESLWRGIALSRTKKMIQPFYLKSYQLTFLFLDRPLIVYNVLDTAVSVCVLITLPSGSYISGFKSHTVGQSKRHVPIWL
jgi:hypothetical protein